MTAVKICGITRPEDAAAAVEYGASYIGFVLWPNSPRAATLHIVSRIAPALPDHVTPVGVFVNPSIDDISAAADAGIKAAQVHAVAAGVSLKGARVPIIPAVHLSWNGIEPDVDDELILLDAHDPVKHGGTGKKVDWVRAAVVAQSRRVILAGGLTPDNVAEAIQTVQPFAVDVASGVEAAPGVKDPMKLKLFIANALGAQGTLGTQGTKDGHAGTL
ncbi:MAG TPA: phosphoribosylanthranilate isomerase [Vicinamibacterales bacterium]|nr:phosphoribosylanthranilate isomerase [Vicinamibacterales bacterium]